MGVFFVIFEEVLDFDYIEVMMMPEEAETMQGVEQSDEISKEVTTQEKDERSAEKRQAWRDEVLWTLRSLQQFRKQRDEDQEAVEDAEDLVWRLEDKVLSYEGITRVLRRSLIFIAMIGVVITFIHPTYWSGRALTVLLAWFVFVGTMCFSLIYSSSKLWRTKDKLADAQFNVKGYKWRLSRSEESVENLEQELMELRKEAPEEYDEFRASLRS